MIIVLNNDMQEFVCYNCLAKGASPPIIMTSSLRIFGFKNDQ